MTGIGVPVAQGERSEWGQVFGPDEPVLWHGAPDRLRLVEWNLAMAVAALILLGPFLANGELSAKVAFLVAFAIVLAAWQRILRVSTWRYALTSHHVAIRREGHSAGVWKYPLRNHFLQDDLGVIRIFTGSYGATLCHKRMVHLTKAERAAALLAARQVPRRRFAIPRKALAQDFETLLPRLLDRAGVPASDGPQLFWTGRPTTPPMVMPMLLGGAAAIVLVGVALIAGVMGDPVTATWAIFGAAIAALAERGCIRWETARQGAARYALAGAYAIQIVPGLPLMPGRCDIRRISADSPLIVDATDVAYGFECTHTRQGWAVGRVTFHQPTEAARLIGHLRAIAGADTPCHRVTA